MKNERAEGIAEGSAKGKAEEEEKAIEENRLFVLQARILQDYERWHTSGRSNRNIAGCLWKLPM